MRNSIPKVILLPSLICISFYTGVQIIGETDASFTSQVSPVSVNISTASVFPTSIKKLENDAQEITDKIIKDYKSITSPSSDLSLQELHNRLAKMKVTELEIRNQMVTLQTIYKELTTYNLQLKNQKESDLQNYDYVKKGSQNVLSNWKEVQSVVNIQQIKANCSSVSLQIKKLEEQKKLDKYPK